MKTDKPKKKRKPFFNFKGWFGWEQIKEGGSTVQEIIRKLFVPSQPKIEESFEEALERLQLTEEDIQQRKKMFGYFCLFFFISACCLLAYALYLLLTGSVAAGLASIGLSALLLGQAFRYHFWLFQIRSRRLGCSFGEWFWYGLLGIKEKKANNDV